MFIAAIFTIVKLWELPRFPCTDEWIKKMWYLYAMELYSATKKNEILSFASKCMGIFSEISQAQSAKICMFFLICGLKAKNNCSNIIGHGSHAKGRTHT
jgi:hypothetical protein